MHLSAKGQGGRHAHACRILYGDPQVAHRAQLLGKRAQKFLGAELLVDIFRSIADQELSEMNRGCNFDTGLCARPPNRDRAGEQRGQEIHETTKSCKRPYHSLCSMRCHGEVAVSDPAVEASSALMTFSLRRRATAPLPSLAPIAPPPTGCLRGSQDPSFQAIRPSLEARRCRSAKMHFSSRLLRHAPMNKCVQKALAVAGAYALSFMRRSKREDSMAWTTPVLVEICVGLEINGYLPPEF
jgi:hypothetical protein